MKRQLFLFNWWKKIINRCWFWLEKLAYRGYAQLVLSILSVTEAIFFPMPPDTLLISLGMSNRRKIWSFWINCTISSVIGAGMAYAIGYFLWWNGSELSTMARVFFEYIPGFTQEKFITIQKLYQKYSFGIVFIAGFTPLPFKVINITAGAASLNFPLFLLAAFFGRGARFLVVSIMVRIWGNSIRSTIKHHLNVISIITFLFIILAIICVYLFS